MGVGGSSGNRTEHQTALGRSGRHEEPVGRDRVSAGHELVAFRSDALGLSPLPIENKDSGLSCFTLAPDENPPAIRKPARPTDRLEKPLTHGLRASGGSRQRLELALLAREDPRSVAGEAVRHAVPQLHWWRSVRSRDPHTRIVRSVASESQKRSVARKVHHPKVGPAYQARLVLLARHQAEGPFGLGQDRDQRPAVGRHIVQIDGEQAALEDALATRKVDRADRRLAFSSVAEFRKPDLFSVRRPDGRPPIDEVRGQHRLVIFWIEDRQRESVEWQPLVEQNPASARGDSRRRNPGGARVPETSGRVLQTLSRPFYADHGEVLSVGVPVGPLDVPQELARRSTGEGHEGEDPALVVEVVVHGGIQEDGQLAARGDRQKLCGRQRKRRRFPARRARRENPRRRARPTRRCRRSVWPSGAKRAALT